jgi:tetratricopeptide (TPR) repeat protein
MEEELFKITPSDQNDGSRNGFTTPLLERKIEKGSRVFKTLDEAFAAFDNLDEESTPAEFLVRNVIVPPVPQEKDIQHYLVKNALLLIDGGEFSLARNVLGEVLRKNNRSVEAIRWMGWCFRQEGQLENAQKCYEQLTQLRVTDQDLFELGEIYYDVKKDDLALSTWLRALEGCDAESPRLFDLHKNLGNVYTRLGDYDSAEENYNKALILRPHSDILQINFGTLAFQRQNYLQAMAHFKQGIEQNPFNDHGWCGVALVAREMRDIEWARATLLKSLDINPYNLVALQVLIHWAITDLKWSEAISRTQIYCEKRQDDIHMLFSLAGLLFQSGDLNSADAELCRVEAMDLTYQGATELRELINEKLG